MSSQEWGFPKSKNSEKKGVNRTVDDFVTKLQTLMEKHNIDLSEAQFRCRGQALERYNTNTTFVDLRLIDEAGQKIRQKLSKK